MKALYGKQAIPHNIRKLIHRESVIREDEIRNEIAKDITVQLLAAVLYTLNVCEDYETEDIQRVFREINGTFEDMAGVGFAGRFDADDLTDLVREKFGIDLKAEVRVGQCTCKGDRR